MWVSKLAGVKMRREATGSWTLVAAVNGQIVCCGNSRHEDSCGPRMEQSPEVTMGHDPCRHGVHVVAVRSVLGWISTNVSRVKI